MEEERTVIARVLLSTGLFAGAIMSAYPPWLETLTQVPGPDAGQLHPAAATTADGYAPLWVPPVVRYAAPEQCLLGYRSTSDLHFCALRSKAPARASGGRQRAEVRHTEAGSGQAFLLAQSACLVLAPTRCGSRSAILPEDNSPLSSASFSLGRRYSVAGDLRGRSASMDPAGHSARPSA
jgi:hypothetical protein